MVRRSGCLAAQRRNRETISSSHSSSETEDSNNSSSEESSPAGKAGHRTVRRTRGKEKKKVQVRTGRKKSAIATHEKPVKKARHQETVSTSSRTLKQTKKKEIEKVSRIINEQREMFLSPSEFIKKTRESLDKFRSSLEEYSPLKKDPSVAEESSDEESSSTEGESSEEEKTSVVGLQAGTANCPRMMHPLTDNLPRKKTAFPVTSKMKLTEKAVCKLVNSTKVDCSLARTNQTARDLIVTSQVYITHDGEGDPLKKTPIPVIQVSTAAINRRYRQDEKITVETSQGDRVVHAYSCPREDIDYKKVMTQKWKKILDCMIEQDVKVPVLPTIGLNAFLPWEDRYREIFRKKFAKVKAIKRKKRNVKKSKKALKDKWKKLYLEKAEASPNAKQCRQLSAEALQKALKSKSRHQRFTQVLLCFPPNPCDKKNQKVFKNIDGALYTICQLNMFDIAHSLCEENIQAGIVNVSDQEALLSGNLGQYWYDGDMSLEEVFPYQTTIILNNWFYTREIPEGYEDYILDTGEEPEADASTEEESD